MEKFCEVCKKDITGTSLGTKYCGGCSPIISKRIKREYQALVRTLTKNIKKEHPELKKKERGKEARKIIKTMNKTETVGEKVVRELKEEMKIPAKTEIPKPVQEEGVVEEDKPIQTNGMTAEEMESVIENIAINGKRHQEKVVDKNTEGDVKMFGFGKKQLSLTPDAIAEIINDFQQKLARLEEEKRKELTNINEEERDRIVEIERSKDDVRTEVETLRKDLNKKYERFEKNYGNIIKQFEPALNGNGSKENKQEVKKNDGLFTESGTA